MSLDKSLRNVLCYKFAQKTAVVYRVGDGVSLQSHASPLRATQLFIYFLHKFAEIAKFDHKWLRKP